MTHAERRAQRVLEAAGIDSAELEHEIALAIQEEVNLERSRCRGLITRNLARLKMAYAENPHRTFLANAANALESALEDM